MREQAEILKYDADTLAQGAAFRPRHGMDITLEDTDRAAGRDEAEINQAHKGGFARAAGSREEVVGARLQSERDILQDVRPTVIVQSYIVELYQGFGTLWVRVIVW